MTSQNTAHELLVEAQQLATLLNVSLQDAFFAILVDRIGRVSLSVEAVETAVIDTSPLSAEEIQLDDDWLVFVVQVETAGSPIQGPTQVVPKGTDISIRQRRHGTDRTGYVARTTGGTLATLTRKELGNNDSFIAKASNLDKFWFNATTDATFFEITIDQKVGG